VRLEVSTDHWKEADWFQNQKYFNRKIPYLVEIKRNILANSLVEWTSVFETFLVCSLSGCEQIF